MPKKGIKRACPDPDKLKFPTRNAAQAALERLNSRPGEHPKGRYRRVYLCQNGCRKWHITSAAHRDESRRYLP